MRRRSFLALGSAGLALAQEPRTAGAPHHRLRLWLRASTGRPGQAGRHRSPGSSRLQSGLKVTGMKVFGVSLTPTSDRPYVFCKLETNQGLVGWGEGTLEGKAGATMACIEDFRDFVIGADPMQVEHIWQSMYVHSFYRAGPVMGSAMSAIDQALWDIRGQSARRPRVQAAGRPARSARRSRLLSRRRRAHARSAAEAARNGHPAGRFVLQDRPSHLLRMDRDAEEDLSGGQVACRCCARISARRSISRSTSTPRPVPASPRSW